MVAGSALCVVGVSLDGVGHAVLGTPTVDDLLARVVGVHDVGPGHVPEVPTFLQLFHGFTNLRIGTLDTAAAFYVLVTNSNSPVNRFSKGWRTNGASI